MISTSVGSTFWSSIIETMDHLHLTWLFYTSWNGNTSI